MNKTGHYTTSTGEVTVTKSPMKHFVQVSDAQNNQLLLDTTALDQLVDQGSWKLKEEE